MQTTDRQSCGSDQGYTWPTIDSWQLISLCDSWFSEHSNCLKLTKSVIVCSGVSRGFSGCPEGFLVARNPPPPTIVFLIWGVTPLVAPTLTSHLQLHVRRSETPLDTNSGYATGVRHLGLHSACLPEVQAVDDTPDCVASGECMRRVYTAHF